MTRRHLEKLQAARRKAQARQRRAWIAAVKDWDSWSKSDATAYAQLVAAREMFGHNSPEAREAYARWREVVRAMPPMSTLPSDSTWRELRGEHLVA